MVAHRAGHKVTGRYRHNPFLYVYNPPVKGLLRFVDSPRLKVEVEGVIAANVHDIRYEHAEDGQPYEHKFETETVALACRLSSGEHVVLLRNAKGANVWEDR